MLRNHNRFPTTGVSRCGMIAAGLLFAACTEGANGGDPNVTELEFMQQANAAVLTPGDTAIVPELKSELDDTYDKLHVVDQRTQFTKNDRDNVLTFRPNRYRTDFSKGDGSGADTVCEDLEVKSDTKYVLAVTDSKEEAWVAFDADGKEVHLCYASKGNPSDVAVWGSNTPR